MPSPLGVIHLDRRCSPVGVYSAPNVVVFQDTFTGVDGTQMVAHSADVAPAGAYQENGSQSPFNGFYARIQSNVCRDTGGTSAQRLLWHSGSIPQNGGGIQFYLDVTRDDAGASGWHPGFQMMVKAPAALAEVSESYIAYFNRVDNNLVTISLRALNNATGQITSGNIAMPVTTGQLRIGATINAGGTITLWYEPYGGGARTTVGTYTPPGGANYFDASHDKVGLYRAGTPGIQGNIGDNFTVATVNPVPGTTWTLPYAVAVDGSEGTIVVVRNDTGEIVPVVRDNTTSVRTASDVSLAGVSVTIGISYNFEATLSTLYMRDRDGKAETRGRTQVRSVTPAYGYTSAFSVEVTPLGRLLRTLSFLFTSPQSDEKRVPVQAENEQALIKIKNTTPYPSRITGLDWEGFYHTRSQRV